MAITKREGKSGVRYLVRIVVDDPATGKKTQRNCGTFRTRREAEKAEREAIIQRDNGTLLKPGRDTVGEVLDQWMKIEMPKSVRPENQVGYRGVIETHLKPRFGSVAVRALTVEMVETFYSDLQEAGKSTSLIRKCHMRLHAALKMSKRHGKVSMVVTEVAKPPRVQYGETGIWNADEVSRFLAAASDDVLSPIWRLALESGARTSELLGVAWSDFDLNAGTIRFGRQVVRLDGGHPIIKLGGKSISALRTIRLTPDLVELLQDHKKKQAEVQLAAPDWQAYGLIFSTKSGKPINARFFRRHFDDIVEDAGVTEIGPHGMRRTSITLCVAAGANVKAISARVGHRDVATTLNIYQRITRGMDDEALDIVSSIVGAHPAAKESQIATLPTPADGG